MDHVDKAEARRLLNLLDTYMRMLGTSRREAERRLGFKHSAVSRLFKGHIEPKLELILGIVRVIGLEYSEFFALAYPEGRTFEPRSESGRYLHGMLQDLYPAAFRATSPAEGRPASRQPAAPELATDRDEMLREVEERVRKLFEKAEAEMAAGTFQRQKKAS